MYRQPESEGSPNHQARSASGIGSSLHGIARRDFRTVQLCGRIGRFTISRDTSLTHLSSSSINTQRLTVKPGADLTISMGRPRLGA